MEGRDRLIRCDGICARCDGAGTIPDWTSGRLPCPACKPMLGSEATQAGAIRQSMGDRCPLCNSDKPRDEPGYGKGAHSFSCGTVFRGNGEVAFRWGACVERAEKCLRRQLAQALAREAQLRRVVEAARHDYNSARTACDYRRGRGDCEAWTSRGMSCSDCPLEWFDELLDSLANLEREEGGA